jgi:hypothetical protein
VLIFAGDHDPTGEDIDRDFAHRVGLFDKVIRVGLNADQVMEYALPFNPDPEVIKKLDDDPRAAKFEARHGYLEQYEVDALDPDVLQDLYRNAIDQSWDPDAYAAVMAREEGDIAELRRMWAGGAR